VTSLALRWPADGRRRRLRIVAYHAVADLRDDPVLAEYAVPPARFSAQLDALLAAGWNFVDLDTALAALAGRPIPRRAILLTFDDAYADLLEAARPLLAERGIPAVVFAVAGHVGGRNDWDHHRRGAVLRLLDAAELREAAAAGIEVGSHTWTHRPLPEVPEAELDRELSGSATRLQELGVARPRAFSYPYGKWTAGLAAAVRAAGYELAFTVDWGVVGADSDAFALPRVEVHASDTPRKLRQKLALAGWPGRLRDLLLWLLGVRLDPSVSQGDRPGEESRAQNLS
jgi:peptidoglycan/xylan/chitin deacetylase (PgdA/CDA1 family)